MYFLFVGIYACVPVYGFRHSELVLQRNFSDDEDYDKGDYLPPVSYTHLDVYKRQV